VILNAAYSANSVAFLNVNSCPDAPGEYPLVDVYKTGAHSPAKAKISFLLDGVTQDPIEWIDGKPAPATLSQISIFDAVTVPIYAEKQNEIEFLPQAARRHSRSDCLLSGRIEPSYELEDTCLI
jgi:hypothetical protein